MSSSTPLFAANVFGFIDDQNQFNYLGLMPQNNWREFSFDQTLIRECQLPAQDSVPAHLLVFIVPRSNDRTKLYLQRRTPENASGELDLFGVIPGKVNNEDFFPDPPKKADVGWLKKHREEIYRLQMAYSDSMTERQKWNTTEEVADRFADRVGITVGQPINDKVLDHACRRAAIRTIREKLGITVPDSRLERLKEPAQVNRPGQHDLFIIVFGLDLSVLDWDTICRRRPHSELKPHTRKQFEHLRDTKGLTEFLMTYFEHVSDYVYETVLVSKCLLGLICQYDGRPPRRTLTPELIERLGFKVLPVCPEESGGLPTPRERVEITGGDGSNVIAGMARVRTQSGQDLTENLIAGAEKVLHLAQHRGVRQMIVRRRSPSCSAGQIPDGTFSHRLVEGVGVTVAMLRSKTDVQVVEFERLVADRFRETMRSILRRYGSHLDWRDDVSQAVQRIREELPLGDASGWREIFSDTFRELLPELHHQSAGRDTPEATDSDTVRFFQDVFRAAWGWELLDPNRRCRICTYPEGFLDTYLAQDSTCSACRTYLENRSLLEDKSRLQALLKIKLSEVRGKHVYDAVVACSGGKDSTYMMMRLKTEYNLNLLAVMDDLNQQNEPAVNNVKTAAGQLGVELCILPPPPKEREIRRNFMREGNTFCRLCLRSHFVRVYEVARNESIPLVCFGLSPYQCLDCTDAIDWSLKAIDDVRTPFHELDYRSLLMRYKHRAFQGGFDAGFIDPREKELYREWETVYDLDKTEFAPIIVPFFLFDGYPDEGQIMKDIEDKVGWKKPEVFLNRTNCRLLRLAGMMHYAVGRYHLNYKERATRLRLDGKLLSEKEAATLGAQMDTPEKEELMGREDFEKAIREELNLSIEELPPIVRERLDKLFALYRKS